MRLHKSVNRVHQGTTYYRWLLAIPPKAVRDLGWTDGQRLEVNVRGNVLWISPSMAPAPMRRTRSTRSEEEELQRRTPSRR